MSNANRGDPAPAIPTALFPLPRSLIEACPSSIDALSPLARVNFDPFRVIAAIVSYTCLDGPLGYGRS